MRPVFTTLLVLLTSTLEATPYTPSSGIHEKMVAQEIALLGVAPQQRSDALNGIYAAAIEDSVFLRGCTEVADEQIADLFSATALMAFYRRDAKWVGRTQCLHAVLVMRDKAEPIHHRKLHGLLISIRRFEQANELRQRFRIPVPLLPSLAPVSESGFNVISMQDNGQLEQTILLPRVETGIQVIAVVHPSCEFSRRGLNSILSNPSYAWLRPHLQLVVPRETAWPEHAMRAWNEKNPEHPMYAQGVGQAWESVGTLETPLFHLLHNGHLIASAHGWSGDGSELEALREALKRLEP